MADRRLADRRPQDVGAAQPAPNGWGGSAGRRERGVLTVLALFYALIFGALGALLPWLPRLLADRGFGPTLIGLGLALGAASRAAFPPLWGWFADRARARREILVGATALGGATLFAIGCARSAPVLLGLLFVQGFLMVPVVPLAETVTLSLLGSRQTSYGRVRLWGSVGFIVSSLGVGAVVGRVGSAAAAWTAGAALLLAALTAARLPSARVVVDRAPEHRRQLSARALAPLLAAAALGQAAHGPYYTLFTLDLTEHGVTPWVIGALWSWAVVAEVALMAGAPFVLARLGLLGALRWSLVLGAARWLVYAAQPPLVMLAAGQALHACSFALLHLATVQLVDQVSPPGRKALGQSLLSASSYGVGGGVGMFLAGRLVNPFGLATLYLGAGAACLAGLVLTLAMSRAPHPAAATGIRR